MIHRVSRCVVSDLPPVDAFIARSFLAAGGSRAIQSGQKDLFPSEWTREQREAAIRQAYRNSKVAGASQGDRVFLVRQGGGRTIEMWLNKATKTIESAWPK